MTDRELQRSFLIDRLAPKRGESILDLGCGAGEDLQQVLRLHPGVRTVGMDSMEQMLRAARNRLYRYIKRGTAELVVGDAGQELPFPSKSFDAVFSVDLLECLPNAKQALLLQEIRRVLKPGGRVLAVHTDWDTQIWNASDRALERKLVHAFCDWTQDWMGVSDGWMGRRLAGLFRTSKFFKGIEVTAHTLINDSYTPGTFGYERSQDLLTLARKGKSVRLAESRRFIRDLGRQYRARTYFYSVTRYFVLARRT
jgi:SAM-dependent methyltransferase